MPITRRTSAARKKADNYDGENDKENIQDKESSVRPSKLKALKKMEENLDHSCSFISTHKKPIDTFDLLYSSPLKQEVNFKPLSFWSKKVKDLESKENVKKKKCELYELSETDESNSSRGSNWGKKPKKTKRTTVGRQKNKKTVKKVVYDYKMKNLVKKDMAKSRNENKEGSMIRERIMLRRLNEKFMDVEDKFSFKKVTALGLTSTPGKSEKLNVVGGSTFDFLSPIPIPEGVLKITHESDSVVEDTTCKSKKENCSYNLENATPKRLRIARNNKKVLKKDLKRVSENGHTEGDYLKDSFAEFDSFTEKLYMGEIARNNFHSVENCEFKIESSSFNCDDTVFDLSSYGDFQDEMNKCFLHVTEDEFDEKIGEATENDEYPKQEYSDNSSNYDPKMCEQIIRTLLSLKILYLSADSDTKPTDISYNDFKSLPDLPLLSATLPVARNRIELLSPVNFGLEDEFLVVEDESTGSFYSNSNTPNNSLVKRNSFSNVTVRRYNNIFLNFRRFAKAGSFDLSHDINNKNQDFSSGTSYTDFVNEETLRIPHIITKKPHSVDNFMSKKRDVDTCNLKDWNNTLVERLSPSQIGIKDQQTHEKRVVEITNYNEMVSNQYRSKEGSISQIGEHLQMYSDSGNDSSVLISSPETPNAVQNVSYSVCKSAVGKESEEEPDDARGATGDELKSSCEEECQVNDMTGFRVESRAKCYGWNWVQDEESETREGSRFVSNSPLKIALVKPISDITFSDDFDFPLPIFESTTCATPIRSSRNNTKRNLADEKKRVDNVVEEALQNHIDFEQQDMSNITSCRLKPGKKWARSAIVLKKSLNGTLNFPQESTLKKRGKMYQTFVEEVLNEQDQTVVSSGGSFLSMTAVTNKMSDLTLTMRGTIGNRTVKVLKEVPADEEMDHSFRSIFINANYPKSDLTVMDGISNIDARELSVREKKLMSARSMVLMHCNQGAPLPFEEYFNEKTLKNCKKIGEGTFGEVFMCNSNRVIKVMPIEGSDEVNGEPQKKFDEILSEIVIAMQLSNLRNTDKYRTNGFCELKRCWCVEGKYPSYLIDLWDDFDSVGRGSENDSPAMFKSDQLYIVLEFGNGGQDLEAFVFTSGEQALSILFQVAYSLAVAENVLEFEHRDMHWGNILIAPTREKYFKVTVNDEEIKIPAQGVKATIIDFTLSRITYDGCCIYNDLAVDPTLFTSEGDYQFEIYRMMKREVMNDWSLFRPKTNIFWLHYVADKMLKMVRYKKTSTKIHKGSLSKLDKIKSKILKFLNSEDFVFNCDFS